MSSQMMKGQRAAGIDSLVAKLIIIGKSDKLCRHLASVCFEIAVYSHVVIVLTLIDCVVSMLTNPSTQFVIAIGLQWIFYGYFILR